MVEYIMWLLNLINANQGAITALATVAIAVVAFLSWRTTRALVRENRLLRKAGMEPLVVAYLKIDSRYKEIVKFALANVGQGAARNIRFRFSANAEDFASHEVRFSDTAERTAIGILPQGDKIEVSLGVGHKLFEKPRLQPFDVIVEYNDMSGKEVSRTYQLDISQFDGWITIGQPAEHEIAEALKKIERNIEHFAMGLRRLSVETMTVAEVNEEMEQHRMKKENNKKANRNE